MDLQVAMADAMEEDRQKKDVNDAKMRAVSQRVDYDQFCNMVAGAHLRPVKPLDKQAARLNGMFVLASEAAPPKAAGAQASAPVSSSSSQLRVPKTGVEFHRTWRRQCKDTRSRAAYLRLVDPALIPHVFQKQFEPDVLGGIVSTLDELLGEVPTLATSAEALPDQAAASGWEDRGSVAEAALLASDWLGMMAEVNQFDLAREFMDEEAKARARSLIARLEALSKCDKARTRSPASEEVRRRLDAHLQPDKLGALRKQYAM